MLELKSTTKIVKQILEDCTQARNSDSFLYLKVIEYLDIAYGTRVRFLTVDVFLKRIGDLSVPGFETVRRARQKIQAQYPELAACDKVCALRSNNEAEYRAFALSKVGVD